MNCLYESAWASLKLRRALFFLGLLTPSLCVFIHSRLRSGPFPSILVPFALLGAVDWFVIGAAFVLAGLFFLLSFRCPRCNKRFLNLNATNRNCRSCGLPIGAPHEPASTDASPSTAPAQGMSKHL